MDPVSRFNEEVEATEKDEKAIENFMEAAQGLALELALKGKDGKELTPAEKEFTKAFALMSLHMLFHAVRSK